jgi:hypothetical protein
MSTVQGGQGNIVTNGLILNLDAANPRSYPQPYNGTIWQNIAPVSSSLTGSLVNGVAYTGSNGGALTFDGVDDYVEYPNINPGNALTVDVWFRKISGTGFQGILGNWNSTGGGDSWLITQDSSNRSSFYIRFNLSAGDNIVDLTTTLSPNTWYNYTGTFSNFTLSIYRNGLLVNSKTTILNTIHPNSLKVWIARFSIFYFSGLIPIGRVYNRALNASEVLQNFNATRARFGI